MNAIKLLLDANSVGFSLNVLKMTVHYSTSPYTRFVNAVGPVLDVSS